MEQLNDDVNEYNIQMLHQPTPKSHHIDISTDGYIDAVMDAHTNMCTDGHINFTKGVVEPVDEEIEDSHTNISTYGYDDDAQCEYNVLYINDDMSTNDLLKEQSYENNTMEKQSAVEETTKLVDAYVASTTATDLVNDKTEKSAISGENFCS